MFVRIGSKSLPRSNNLVLNYGQKSFITLGPGRQYFFDVDVDGDGDGGGGDGDGDVFLKQNIW